MMVRRRNRKMMVTIGIVVILIGTIITYFNIPFSMTKNDFINQTNELSINAGTETDLITDEDIAHLPEPVQKYFRYCGLIGEFKSSYAILRHHNVDFALGRKKPMLKIEYTQYNYVSRPDRIAYIDSSLYGIPFEGIDAYVDGSGSMKGIIAKHITLSVIPYHNF